LELIRLLVVIGLWFGAMIAATGAVLGGLSGAWKGGPGGRGWGAFRRGAPMLALAGLCWSAGQLMGVATEAAWHEDLMGVRLVGPTVLESVESERHFNGDGASWTLYAMPDEVCEVLRHEPTRLSERPVLGEGRTRWTGHTWVQGPLPTETWTEIKWMAEGPDAGAARLDAWNTGGAWIAYNEKRGPSGDLSDLDLFILDVDACTLLVANHNT
jgi:hypothetical protein